MESLNSSFYFDLSCKISLNGLSVNAEGQEENYLCYFLHHFCGLRAVSLSSWIVSESVIYTWPADPGSLRLCHNIFTFYNKNPQLNQWNWRNNHDWNKSPGFFRILQKQVHIILKVSWNYLYCFWSIHDIRVPIFYLKSCKFMNLFCWFYARPPCCQDKQNKWQNYLILFYFLQEQKR